jgi:transposase-like protein
MSILSAAHFHSEEAAYAYVEARVWPEGRICPHCGSIERSGKLGGKSTRIGLYKCYDCRKPFTVKIGTIFEGSHVALRLWLQAIFLLQEGHQFQSASPDLGGHPENRLVHVPSDQGSHALGRSVPDG